VVGHFALTDMPLALLVSASTALLFSALKTSRTWLVYPAYAVAGLAVLQKGPIGLFLIGIGLLLYLIVSSRTIKEFFKSVWSLNPIVGLLIVLVIALPWYVTESMITKGAFIQEFFLRQTFSRISGTLDHLLPFWFYIPIVLAGAFPWSLFLVGTIKQTIRRFKKRFSENTQDALSIFCLLSSATIFLFFSAVPSKLPTYIIPVLPPAAVLTGIYLDTLLRSNKAKAIFWTAPVMLALALIIPLVGYGKFSHYVDPFVPLAVVAVCLIVSWVVYLVLLAKNKLRKAIILLATSSLLAVAICVPTSLMLYQHAYLKDFQDLVIWCKGEDLHPMVYTSLKPSASFYTHYAVPPIISAEHLANVLIEGKSGVLILISDKKIQEISMLPFKTNTQLIKRMGTWNLVNAKLMP
jgi:4-amino-4-deoxy-L-arabinose transferase-like glycosyltransferase